jgi:hypothetical protein
VSANNLWKCLWKLLSHIHKWWNLVELTYLHKGWSVGSDGRALGASDDDCACIGQKWFSVRWLTLGALATIECIGWCHYRHRTITLSGPMCFGHSLFAKIILRTLDEHWTIGIRQSVCVWWFWVALGSFQTGIKRWRKISIRQIATLSNVSKSCLMTPFTRRRRALALHRTLARVVSYVASDGNARRQLLAATVTFKWSSDGTATHGTSNTEAMFDAPMFVSDAPVTGPMKGPTTPWALGSIKGDWPALAHSLIHFDHCYILVS